MNNASITSGASAAIYIANCDDAAITLAAGSENTLANGGSFEAIDEKNIDGAVYATKDLTLSGDGSLNVTSPAGHGIVAKDDLTVSGGSYTITAVSHGVTAKDNALLENGAFTIEAGKDGVHCENTGDAALGNLTVSGGSYAITADGDGIDSNGTITMTGGQVFVSGPTNSGNGALDYGISATITGGTIVAAGASGMAENFTSAEGQGVMLVSTGAQQAGNTIQLADASGNVLLTWQPEKAYECVVISTPDVQQGGAYTLTAGSGTQTIEMTGAVYGGGMGMGGMGGQPGQMGQIGGQPGQMGGGRPGGGMGRP